MNSKFDIIDTILRAAGGENYVKNFKEYRIDLSCLKLLSDEDLKIIGVDDVETRKNILKHCTNLQIRLEMRTDLVVDKKYAETVLLQMINQLQLHYANLACTILRKDTTVCDIKLRDACHSLSNNLQQLRNEINSLQQKLIPTRKTKKCRKIIFITTTVLLVGFALKILILK